MEERKRPIGISILSFLFIVGGVGGVIAFLLGIGSLDNPNAKQSLSMFGLTPIKLVVLLSVLGGFSVAAGIGMWIGRKWGWYLGSLYCMY